MKFRTLAAFSVLAIAAFIASSSRSAPTTAPAKPIPIEEVRARGITGELGERLGKIVKIHGVAVDGNTLDWKAAQGNWFVRVSAVDDRQLKTAVLIQVRTDQKLKHGQHVFFAGYETGGYVGIVDHEFDYVPSYGGPRYYFLSEFVILKSL